MENERQFLIERFSRLLECAEQDQANVTSLIVKLDRQVSAYDETCRQLRQGVRLDIATQVDTALTKSIQKIIDDRLALNFLFAGAITLLFKWYFPSPAEVQKLKRERDQLEANLERLKDAGALGKIAKCQDTSRDRLCIRVDKAKAKFGTESTGTYFIIDGY